MYGDRPAITFFQWLRVAGSTIADLRVGNTHLADWRAELAGAVAPLLSDLSDDDWAAISRTLEILGASA